LEKALVHIFNSLQLENTSSSSQDKFQILVNYLDHLVTHDFNKLLSILYRVDVSEEKAKHALADKKEEETNGFIMAKLLIERETEKLKWRAKYRKDSKS
jgi:hypothetical protein